MALLQSVTNWLILVIFAVLSYNLVKFCMKQWHMYVLSRNVPGPKGLPIIGYAHHFLGLKSSGDLAQKMFKLFTYRKSILKFWFGEKLVYAITDPKYFEVILNHPGSIDKESFMYHCIHNMFGKGLITAPAEHWKKNRKTISRLFNQSKVNQFQPIMADHCNVLIEELNKNVKIKDEEFYVHVFNCVFDIVAETVFESKGNAQITKANHAKYIMAYLDAIVFRCLKIWNNFDVLYNLTDTYKQEIKSVHYLQNLIMQFTNQKIQDFKENSSNQMTDSETSKSFIATLIDKYEANELTYNDIRDESVTIYGAASHTSTATICFILSMLGMHPEQQARAYAEIETHLGPAGAPISTAEVIARMSQCTFIDQVIRETLRLFPGAPVIGRSAAADIRLDEAVTIPRGASLWLGLLSMHRDAAYWPEPNAFRPERFARGAPKYHPYAYLPFSGGARNCVGLKYALTFTKLAVVMLVKEFEFATDWKEVDEIKTTIGIVLHPTTGFKISFKKRCGD